MAEPGASLAPALAELERLLDAVLASEMWGEEFPTLTSMFNPALRPVIVVSSRGRKATVNSWYTPGVWGDADEALLLGLAEEEKQAPLKRAEIVISSEVLADPVQATAELVRQMLAHAIPGLRPKEGSYYYAKEWRGYAQRADCTASINPEQPSKGWSVWEPVKEFTEWANQTIHFEAFALSRDGSAVRFNPGSRMKKWRCHCTTVRCAVKLNALCDECGYKFAWAEAAQPDPYAEHAAPELGATA